MGKIFIPIEVSFLSKITQCSSVQFNLVCSITTDQFDNLFLDPNVYTYISNMIIFVIIIYPLIYVLHNIIQNYQFVMICWIIELKVELCSSFLVQIHICDASFPIILNSYWQASSSPTNTNQASQVCDQIIDCSTRLSSFFLNHHLTRTGSKVFLLREEESRIRKSKCAYNLTYFPSVLRTIPTITIFLFSSLQ